MELRARKAPVPGRPRSLRLRLMLWYSTLITIALGCFGILIIIMTTRALNQVVDNTLSSETRVASLDLTHELLPVSPYWPARLSMTTIDTYSEPGVVVEVVDTRGEMRYSTTTSPTIHIPFSSNSIQAVLTGQTLWYTTRIGGQHVRIEASPVTAPANGTTSGSGPIIGMVLVAKSLINVDATLLTLQVLLLLVGLATLVGTLIGSWLIATRVLQPLAEIVATARAIVTSTVRGTRLGNLSRRVPRPHGHDEMVLVVETFNEMLASLESATRAQRRFVADASHELRAPLTTIQGNLAFLQRHLEELPPDERRIMLADAHEETLRLAKLVEDLLLLARENAGEETPRELSEKTVTREEKTRDEPPIELDHAVLQLARQLRRRLSMEGSPVKLEIGHIEPVRVHGDEESLRRVALILLDNALKYTPSSSEEGMGRVIVSVERINGQAVLRVRDTGIGIDPKDVTHLFERFYRADRARSRQGTGLGLSIAQTLVERMGGHITVESAPGKGSVFSVWLPLA